MQWDGSQGEPLDELLRRADWPQPTSEQLNRLELTWQRTLRRRRLRIVAQIAAVLLVPTIGLIGWLSWTGGDHIKVEPTLTAQHVTMAPPEKEPTPVWVREPNEYEKLMVQYHRHAKPPAARQTEIAVSDKVEELIERLSKDPMLQPAALVADLRRLSPKYETLVRECYLNSQQTASQRHAALRLLSQIATTDSLNLLLTAVREGDCPEETSRAAARLASDEQLASLAREEGRTLRQKTWLTSLLKRGTQPAVAAYLELAADPVTSKVALEAARGLQHVPVDELFAALASSRVSMRLAAAEVLGALDDPNVSRRLAKMALANVGRREALIALLASSDPIAREFVAYAHDDSSLGPTVKALSSRFGLN